VSNAEAAKDPEVKSLETLIEEETQKIRAEYPNPKNPAVYLKLLRALESKTWGKRMLGSYR
jgi:hypothetical protein